jgi:hypothetical protein
MRTGRAISMFAQQQSYHKPNTIPNFEGRTMIRLLAFRDRSRSDDFAFGRCCARFNNLQVMQCRSRGLGSSGCGSVGRYVALKLSNDIAGVVTRCGLPMSSVRLSEKRISTKVSLCRRLSSSSNEGGRMSEFDEITFCGVSGVK